METSQLAAVCGIVCVFLKKNVISVSVVQLEYTTRILLEQVCSIYILSSILLNVSTEFKVVTPAKV